MRVFAKLAANQFGAAEHIAPLIVAAKLHVAVIVLEEVVKVVRLHDHIVKLKKAQALLHTLFIALGPQHIINGEAGAYFTQKLNIV